MRHILLLFSLLVSYSSYGNTVYDVYESKFSEKETGVYDGEQWVFFVIKQECLTQKKYAGTQESKEAEKTFYKQLVSEIAKRNVSFSNDISGISEPLRTDVKNVISANYNVVSNIPHQLVFDRNSKRSPCTQEYVATVKTDLFKNNGIKIPNNEVENIVIKLLINALSEGDYSTLSAYLHSLELSKLAAIYEMLVLEDVISINLRTTDRNQVCTQAYCRLANKPFSEFDINHVVSTSLLNQGFVKFENKNPSNKLAEHLYEKASVNFNHGKNPEEIINDLTLAVNLDPNNSKYWKMLANIYRALGKNKEAYAATVQYVLQNPNDAETWVYFYLAEKKIHSESSEDLNYWLNLLKNHVQFSSWAKKQIGN
jgi:tetratricopeptide (TPR) repeat protein